MSLPIADSGLRLIHGTLVCGPLSWPEGRLARDVVTGRLCGESRSNPACRPLVTAVLARLEVGAVPPVLLSPNLHNPSIVTFTARGWRSALPSVSSSAREIESSSRGVELKKKFISLMCLLLQS